MSTKTCNISETVQYRTKIKVKSSYYDGLIGSRLRAFDSYQNQWPWMNLNDRNALLRENNVLRSPLKIEWRATHTIRGKMYSSIILVSRIPSFLTLFMKVDIQDLQHLHITVTNHITIMTQSLLIAGSVSLTLLTRTMTSLPHIISNTFCKTSD